jgi:hypothetical protein
LADEGDKGLYPKQTQRMKKGLIVAVLLLTTTIGVQAQGNIMGRKNSAQVGSDGKRSTTQGQNGTNGTSRSGRTAGGSSSGVSSQSVGGTPSAQGSGGQYKKGQAVNPSSPNKVNSGKQQGQSKN